MMKPIFFLFLVFSSVFSCSALECLISASNQTETCLSEEFCIATAVIDRFGRQYQKKYCSPSSLCRPLQAVWSFNLGYFNETQPYVCCNTDRCNTDDLPYPDTTKNGLQCYTCPAKNSTTCRQTLDCVGVQDRCVNGTERGTKTYGCISRNLCPPPSQGPPETNSTEPTCCATSFCNSAEVLPGPRNSASSIGSMVVLILTPLAALIW